MASASLSVSDPTLIDGLGDQLADDFARRIFDAIPDISECIDYQATRCAGSTGKLRLQRASQLLHSAGHDLQLLIATVIRRIFREKLSRLLVDASSNTRVSMDGMTLLADERLDEEIAINHCSRRLKEQCEFELWALTRRLAIVAGTKHPSDGQNPVFPQVFAQALMEAIDSFETDAAVRMAAFKTCGPTLLDIVPAVYAAANRDLTAHGINVESSEYYGIPVVAAERRSEATPIAHAWRDGLRDIEAKIAGASIDRVSGARTLHGARLALQEKFTPDEQVVGDLVTVVFDRLHTDPRLPVQLRKIVARLQLPVLELSLSDYSHMTRPDHPLRKLIDLIAEFGLTLGLDDDDASTLRSVGNIIDGLVRIRNEEPNVFKLAFDHLDDFFYHHEEAALQSDNSLRELERREAADFAGSQADREIAQRLQNLMLPVAIGTFITEVWREVLVGDYLQCGPAGEPWKLSLATIDDLVGSLRPSTTEVELRTLANTLPERIEMRLNSQETNANQQQRSVEFFAELRRVQQLAIAGRWAEIGGERFVASTAALAISPRVVSPSALLANLGLACGDWFETRDFAGIRRWRLSWVTSILGTCILKHYESNSTRNMSCEELHDRLLSGEVKPVDGIGLADDVFNSAIETVLRKARRAEATLANHAPAIAKSGMAIVDMSQHWTPPVAPSTPAQNPAKH